METVGVRSVPSSHEIASDEKHSLPESATAASFSDGPPLTPSGRENCCLSKEPKSPRPPITTTTLPHLPQSLQTSFCWRLNQSWGREGRKKMDLEGRPEGASNLFIFKMIASSLNFAPRFLRPSLIIYFILVFEKKNVKDFPPACTRGTSSAGAASSCALTDDFEAELKFIHWFFSLALFPSFLLLLSTTPPRQKGRERWTLSPLRLSPRILLSPLRDG